MLILFILMVAIAKAKMLIFQFEAHEPRFPLQVSSKSRQVSGHLPPTGRPTAMVVDPGLDPRIVIREISYYNQTFRALVSWSGPRWQLMITNGYPI